MYLKPSDKHWLIDIETDGLDPAVIWVLCAINVGTGEEKTLTDIQSMKDFINEAQQAGCFFVGHNIISFDVPVLNRLAGTRIPVGRCVDTFLLSMLYSPSLAGGHSLEAWGTRLGFPKTSFSDWSQLSDAMVAYCLNDCRVNVRLFVRLTERMVSIGFSERCCEIEHKAWAIIQQQKRNGFQLDVPKAHELYATLRELERNLQHEIYEQWPPKLIVVKSFAKSRKADGSYTANYARHLEQYPEIRETDDGGYQVLDLVEFNLGSPKQRIEKLLELGWQPREFTPTGQPQATKKGNLSPSLEEFLQETPNEAVRKLAEWIAINSRANNVSTWIDVADEKGLIHGNLWLAGSLRYRHDKPNTANIPAVRLDGDENPRFGRAGVYTYESRDLWTTRDRRTRSLVGVDAAGVQLRILAQYLNNSSFTEAILSSDPHSVNQERMKLSSRALAKTIVYATLMGAGDGRIASEAKVNLKEARDAKNKFFSQVPELPALIHKLQTELKRTGRITLCSGAKVLVPSDHMVIPYLLQGDESQIMKQAMIFANDMVRRRKLDVLKVADVHDEWQSDVLKEHAEEFAYDVCPTAFGDSGKSFDYIVPIACNAKIGVTWAECH